MATPQLLAKLRREAFALGYRREPSTHQPALLEWIQNELDTREEATKRQRIAAWRRRLQDNAQNVYRWLAQNRQTTPLTGILHQGRPLSRDAFHTATVDFWRQIWPSHTSAAEHQRAQNITQLTAASTPWPVPPVPPALQPLTGNDFQRSFRKMKRKASGLDGWTANELSELPICILDQIANYFMLFEAGAPWPPALLLWRQTHLQKPGKPPGLLDSLRPISIGSILYRAWAHIRSQHLSQWICDTLPQQLHGGLRNKGLHTALPTALMKLEAQQAYCSTHRGPNPSLPSFLGAADLTKAFDKLAFCYPAHALGRMGFPAGLTHALSRAWEHQTRWIQLGRHVGSAAQINIGSLPQGDPFSPLALNVCIAEAMHRLIQQYPQSDHLAYLDDRSWLTTSADQAARIALTWQSETRLLEMSENRSKLEFSTTLGSRGRQALVHALQAHNFSVLDSTIVVRPKLLGSRLTLTRQHAAAQKEEAARLNKAKLLGKWVRALPHSVDEKAFFFKATALAVAAAPTFSRLPSLDELKPLLRAFSDLNHQASASLGPNGPLFRLFSGHTADAKFRVGSQVSSHILDQARQDQNLAWHTAQTQGPLALTRRWLARQGWSVVAPWTFAHKAAHITLTCQGSVRQLWPQQFQHFTHHFPSTKPALQHILRDAWRALQWHNFRTSGTLTAHSFQHMAWPTVRARWQQARAALNRAPQHHKPHMLAAFLGHWVSQARYVCLGRPTHPCVFCGASQSDRHHEWRCTALRTTNTAIPDDLLFDKLAWPWDARTETLTHELASVRAAILRRRYPAT